MIQVDALIGRNPAVVFRGSERHGLHRVPLGPDELRHPRHHVEHQRQVPGVHQGLAKVRADPIVVGPGSSFGKVPLIRESQLDVHHYVNELQGQNAHHRDSPEPGRPQLADKLLQQM
eukprot:16447731-Heterocapsa_arctica.AAC.1